MENPLTESVYKQRSTQIEEDVRGCYFRDQTAIIHSMPFRRLKHKTQVFYAPENDHICTRIEHVMHVATIAKTICKGLNANGWNLDVEMAFAIGLGHDLGHAPFGHDGEYILNQKIGPDLRFIHEIHSHRVVQYLANEGSGLNLTYGVKDGIICHNGEKFERLLRPINEINVLEKINDRKVIPSSYEGCVVRFSDKIAYLGRDIEDAIIAGFIKSGDIPENVRKQIGKTNSEIINAFVLDMIDFSKDNEFVGLSEEKYELMLELRNFNYTYIYKNEKRNAFPYAKKILTTVFDYLLELLSKNGNNFAKYQEGKIKLDKAFGHYLLEMHEFYGTNTNPVIIVADYVAGMTDHYAIECMKQIMIPVSII